MRCFLCHPRQGYVPTTTSSSGVAKPDTENLRGLNLVAVKLMTIHVSKLPLWHKIRKIGEICFAKPLLTVLTEDLCTMVQNE
jgi:hypothetical protein